MNYFNYCLISLILVNIILISYAKNIQKSDACSTKKRCGDCIQENDCIWCSKSMQSSKSGTNFTRCIPKSEYTSEWCPTSFTNNPDSKLTIIKDLPLKSAINQNDPVIQIRPQKVQLKLRRNREYRLHFQYAQAIDYPVDLYYLMDLSTSMNDDLINLSKLGNKLADAMRNLTKNFQMGFGSFIDKVAAPFSSVPKRSKYEQPCNSGSCTRTYSYKNHLRLDSDTSRFTMEIKKAHTAGNIILEDPPEGGFDAILQSIVCQKEIGWRENATHLLVFSTDDEYHFAGDGKLAGIVEPHDGRCYLNENGEYTHALKFDYPSISFINRHVRKHNIDLVFAVTKKHEELYRDLANRISGAQLGILDKDSKNVVEVISNIYEKLKQTVVITGNAGSDIDIKYFTACLDGKGERQTNNCSDIRFNRPVNFTAVIKATSCQNKKQTIEIKPRSLNESLIVELEVECECDCEMPHHVLFKAKSEHCNSAGDLTCGVCSCNPGRVGEFCECDNNAGLNACKLVNHTDICSGRGHCKCGKCICDKGRRPGEEYSGPYCECDNFSCRKVNDKICNGHGTCECHRHCHCESDFTGPACECDLRNMSCIEPGKKSICSGIGTCQCGKCDCPTEPIRYWGRYCEMCSDCPGQRCSEFIDCVECQAFSTEAIGKYSAEQCNIYCSNFTTIGVDDLKEDAKFKNDTDFKICEHIDMNGCTIFFKFFMDDVYGPVRTVYVQKEKKCPKKVPFYAILLLVAGTVVLGGIICLVIWKLVTEVHDRREFARFAKEQQNAKWQRGENPLYKPATTTFTNPAFEQ